MKPFLSFLILALLAAPSFAQDPAAPKGPADWKVEVLFKHPQVNYCSVVCCAPDGRVFLAEDPMDMVGPSNKPIDRILCIHPDGRITTFAENLYAVFGLVYMDGKLYVHHCPKFSVFDDGGDVGKNRVDLIESTHPQPWAGMNDHIPANIRLGMDGWFYMSVGDKGIFGAVGKDGSKAEIIGGGILRFRPDATKLEVFSTGTRNHLDMAINAEDEMFTYDNTDDGLGWWTKVTHMVDGGFYGYPYDYKPRRPYTLWAMNDYGGGSPTGALAYNEDALPPEYHGNLFMCEWGKGQLARFVVERQGGSYKIKSRDAFLQKSKEEFRPVGVAVSADGMSIYVADWNFGGWANRGAKAGRLIKATYQGKSQAAPKPDWFLPAAMGKPFQATLDDLVQGLRHPAQSVRFVAMRRVAERGAEAVPALEKLVADTKAPAFARWTAIWTLDRMAEGQGRAAIVAALADADPSVRRQAARQLGGRQAIDAVAALSKLLSDDDRSVRFQAATALGRIGDPKAVAPLLDELVDDDLFARYAAFTALHRIGSAQPKAWSAIAGGLASDKTPVREGALFAFRDAYDPAAVETLAQVIANPKIANDVRGQALTLIGELSRKRPAWKGQWWGTRPAAGKPPARTVDWAGTKTALEALQAGLKDADALVRQSAARGMLATTDSNLANDLAVHIATEKDVATRREILKLLASTRSADPGYVKRANVLVVGFLNTPDDPELLAQAINLAASLPSTTPEVAELVLKRLDEKLPAQQQTALLDVLAKTPSAKGTSAIIARAGDGDPGVVQHAVKLLITMKGMQPTQALIGALKNPSPAVRKEAAAALGKRKDLAAVPPLVALANDKDAKFEIVAALAQMPDVRALNVYVDNVDSKNPQQRDAVLNAIKTFKTDALPLLETRLGKQPPLPAETILALQKFYAADPALRKGPLFSTAAKTISIADFTAAALKEKGSIDRGRALFMDVKGAACIKCHKVGPDAGADLGPDLRGIGVKYNRLQLAESVLEPSKLILDGYIMTVIETKAGQIIQGIVRTDADDEVTLVDAEGKKLVLKKSDIETREKSKKSIMPDGLHVGMTTSEFADLLSYLESLKEKAPPLKTSQNEWRREMPLWRLAPEARRLWQPQPDLQATIELLQERRRQGS